MISSIIKFSQLVHLLLLGILLQYLVQHSHAKSAPRFQDLAKSFPPIKSRLEKALDPATLAEKQKSPVMQEQPDANPAYAYYYFPDKVQGYFYFIYYLDQACSDNGVVATGLATSTCINEEADGYSFKLVVPDGKIKYIQFFLYISSYC
jgi:hypothetical protein